MKKIKTRFAPSPTGNLHLGSIRTALYSWLVARKYNGEFILRIEDTDHKRFVCNATETIIESMNWLNLNWDGEPYLQTERLDLYNAIIDKMLKEGTAYKCYCSKSRLEKLREEQILKGEKPRYDGFCRRNHRESFKEKLHVVRFANPEQGRVVFNDQIRGIITFSNEELDDLIICRTDGSPTYNFCAAIDDWDMSITHVIRGEDHINNTPRQINILKSLNAPIPAYAHLSMINEENGKRLSKRQGAMSVMQYRDEGYLPEALLNYLVRLGWSYADQEIFNREEMIKLFSLRKVNKSTSTFNKNKLLWLNHHYINTLPVENVATHLQWHTERENINTKGGLPLSELVKLLGRRCKTLKEITRNCRYFYEEFTKFEEEAAKKYLNLAAQKPLELVRDKISGINNWTTENVHSAIQASASELKIQMKEVGMPLRVAITGTVQSPALDLTVHAIGKIRCVLRINKALSYIINRNN